MDNTNTHPSKGTEHIQYESGHGNSPKKVSYDVLLHTFQQRFVSDWSRPDKIVDVEEDGAAH
eukprot:261521-Prorocentrum_lima.AAC.1